jgi:AraC family transcriptional regulator
MKLSTEQDYKARILRVLVHIQTHLDEAVALEELADLANFSPFHFHRVFRGMVGESVMEHIRRLRLERSATQLKHSPDSVTAIAFDAGYETLDAYIRAFRNLFGMPPTAFRETAAAVLEQRAATGISYHPEGDLEDFNPLTEGALTMDVTIKPIPPTRVIFVRDTGPYGHSAMNAWEKLCRWAGPRGLLNGKPTFIGLSHDDPDVTPAAKIRYDACLVATRDVQPEGEIGVQEIGGGDYAVTVHKGPYENLSATYAALCGQWIPQKGYRLRTLPPLEIYLNSPESTPPEELLTEVCVPVEKGM